MLRLAAAAILVLAATSASAPGGAADMAKSGSYDLTNCYAGTSRAIVHAKGQIAFSYVMTGVARANKPGGVFDMMSFQCVGVAAILKGKSSNTGWCEYIDAAGDKILGHGGRSGTPTGQWEFVNGTGKFTGITGGGPYKVQGPFPMVRRGHFQGCNTATGNYKLP